MLVVHIKRREAILLILKRNITQNTNIMWQAEITKLLYLNYLEHQIRDLIKFVQKFKIY